MNTEVLNAAVNFLRSLGINVGTDAASKNASLGEIQMTQTLHPNAAVLITPAMAVSRLIAGLRAIPDDHTLIGHHSAHVNVRNSAAKQMVLWARGFADSLSTQATNEAVCSIRMSSNQLANLDPHKSYVGEWAHVAVMSSGARPTRYVLGRDGVIGSYWTETDFQNAVAAGHVIVEE